MRSPLLALRACAARPALPALAAPPGLTEPHHRLDTRAPGHAQSVALTLDACGGAYDAAIVRLLVQQQVPATVFVTRRWLRRNPQGLRELLAHPQLFELQDHGAEHVPAMLGGRLYGMPGRRNLAELHDEVQGGAQAVAAATGRAPRWYRGAGAAYDAAGLAQVAALGLPVAGFSLNADDGAQLRAPAVARRLLAARPGDVILAHMNHPLSGTAAGLATALPVLQRRGLRFVTLGQAAGLVALP